MPILVSCHCGQTFQTGDEFAGRRTKCPDCGRQLVIAQAITTVAPPTPQPSRKENDETETSTRAIASLIFGLTSFLCLFMTGIPAIILGGLAISDIKKSQGRLRGKWLAVFGVLLGMLGSTAVTLLIATPAFRWIREDHFQSQCHANLGRIGHAIHQFQWDRGRFPAAAITDRQGKPLLSWRVAILPFLGKEEAALYEEFRLDEPWDSIHNATLIQRMPVVFACPDEPERPRGTTIYQALVGRNAMFTGARKGIKIDEVTDGTSSTIMLAEAAKSVIWTAPDELTRGGNATSWGFGSRHSGSFNTLFADGSVRFIPVTIAPVSLVDMTTRNGGEVVTPPF